MYRQGDVLIMKVDKLPKEFQEVDWSKEGRVILAYGEVTGHAHALPLATTSMYSWQGDRLIEVKEKTQLTHEEHDAITLDPGVYKVIQQREYTPQGVRDVLD